MPVALQKKNSSGFPKSLKNDGVWEKGKARGAVRSIRVGDVLCLQWKDKRVIAMFSTKYSKDHHDWVQRKTKVNGQFQRSIVCRPQVVADYNNHMGGVDQSDQMFRLYSVQSRTKKWWKTLFLHFLTLL